MSGFMRLNYSVVGHPRAALNNTFAINFFLKWKKKTKYASATRFVRFIERRTYYFRGVRVFSNRASRRFGRRAMYVVPTERRSISIMRWVAARFSEIIIKLLNVAWTWGGQRARRRGLRLYVNFNDAATIGATCDPPHPSAALYGTSPAAPVENLCRFYFNKPRIKLGMRTCPRPTVVGYA